MRLDLLKQMADHLQSGKLGHEIFDFRVINTNLQNGIYLTKQGECGTNGCAMGELPMLDPEHWEFVADSVGLVGDVQGTTLLRVAVSMYYDIPQYVTGLLFFPVPYPPLQSPLWHQPLSSFATREQVAANIYRFIAFAGSGSEEAILMLQKAQLESYVDSSIYHSTKVLLSKTQEKL